MATPEGPEATAFEVKRMQMQQSVIEGHMNHKLVLAPLDLSKPGLEILDVCCSDGQWLKDVQKNAGNPSTKFYGADINELMFPKELPPNTQLVKQDFTEPFPSEWQNKFDLVHQRFALPAAMGKSLQNIINSLVGMVKPGGYIQVAELDHNDMPDNGQPFLTIFKLLAVMLDVWGVGHDFIDKVPGWLKEAGVEDVTINPVVVPFGARYPNDKQLQQNGKDLMVTTAGALAANSAMWPPVPGVTREQIEALPQTIAHDMDTIGGAYKFLIITGRKPA